MAGLGRLAYVPSYTAIAYAQEGTGTQAQKLCEGSSAYVTDVHLIPTILAADTQSMWNCRICALLGIV